MDDNLSLVLKPVPVLEQLTTCQVGLGVDIVFHLSQEEQEQEQEDPQLFVPEEECTISLKFGT